MAQHTLGIDHPLVTVRDHGKILEDYRKLGFNPSPCSYHPWGTVTSLVVFPDNFIELIAVYDASKFGTNAAGDFCFGRFLGEFLQREQGLSLVALHSKDSRADHRAVTARGLHSQGLIDFKRDMTLPDGTPGQAVVSLALFIDGNLPEASNFICHQHRPELIWVPEWQNHPNGAIGVTGVTYLAQEPQQMEARLQGFYGPDKVSWMGSMLIAKTGCGDFRVVDEAQAHDLYPGVPLPEFHTERPHGIAITVAVAELARIQGILEQEGVSFQQTHDGLLVLPQLCGNIILEFVPA